MEAGLIKNQSHKTEEDHQNIKMLTALIAFVMPIYNKAKPGMYVW